MNQHLPQVSIANARFPQAYEAAKQALSKCESIDECKDWADKAAALASYAKQAGDEDLEKQSIRIRARAIRRMGELLKQFDGRGRPSENTDVPVGISQREAASQAGISERRQLTASRVASVPESEFEEQVKKPEPPTIGQLARMGVRKPLIDLQGRDPAEFNKALHYVGAFERYARDISEHDHAGLISILNDEERQRIRVAIAKIDGIHDTVATRV